MVYLLKLINLSGKVYMIVNSSNAKMYIYTFVSHDVDSIQGLELWTKMKTLTAKVLI